MYTPSVRTSTTINQFKMTNAPKKSRSHPIPSFVRTKLIQELNDALRAQPILSDCFKFSTSNFGSHNFHFPNLRNQSSRKATVKIQLAQSANNYTTNMSKSIILSVLAAVAPLAVQANPDIEGFVRIVGGNDAELGDYPYYGK